MPSAVLFSSVRPTPESLFAHMVYLSHPPHRFQTDFASVSEWLIGASKHLKTWSNLADTPDLNQECIHNNLIRLLVRLSRLLSMFMHHQQKLTIVLYVLLTQEKNMLSQTFW